MLRTAFTDTWEEIDSFWFHRLVNIDRDSFQLNINLHCRSDKSFVDDLVASGYCKHESNLCVARCWGLSLVSMICSSLYFKCLILTVASLPWFEFLHHPDFVARRFVLRTLHRAVAPIRSNGFPRVLWVVDTMLIVFSHNQRNADIGTLFFSTSNIKEIAFTTQHTILTPVWPDLENI